MEAHTAHEGRVGQVTVVEVTNAGDMLLLLIPRDDFATLMDTVARLEQHAVITAETVTELSRIASDLSQQADAQD